MITKRIVANPGGGNNGITKENASAMQVLRYERTRERIRDRVLSEIQSLSDIPANTPEDAYAYVVAKKTVDLLDYSKPAMDDVIRLGEIMDVVPRKQQQEQSAGGVSLHVGADAIRQLLQLVNDGLTHRIEDVSGVVDAYDNDTYRKQLTDVPPPLTHPSAHLFTHSTAHRQDTDTHTDT